MINATATEPVIDGDRPLEAWTDGVETWIGHGLADIRAMRSANYGVLDGETPDDEWMPLLDDQQLTIKTGDDRAPPKVTKSVADWIASDGRGLLCSTEI